MNKEKLINAIGYLDDQLIAEAKEERKNRSVKHTGSFAAAIIAVCLTPLIALAGMYYTLTHTGCASKGEGDISGFDSYAISDEEFRRLLQSTVEENAYDFPGIVDGLIPYVPGFFDLLYADEEKVIFDYYPITDDSKRSHFTFVYAYDVASGNGYIEYAIDVQKIGVDDAGITFAEENGRYLYIEKILLADGDDWFKSYYYEFDLITGEWEEVDVDPQTDWSWTWEHHRANKMVGTDQDTYTGAMIHVERDESHMDYDVYLKLSKGEPLKKTQLCITDESGVFYREYNMFEMHEISY